MRLRAVGYDDIRGTEYLDYLTIKVNVRNLRAYLARASDNSLKATLRQHDRILGELREHYTQKQTIRPALQRQTDQKQASTKENS